MKYKHLLVLILCFFSVVGCKDKTTEGVDPVGQTEVKDSPFKVTLKVIAQKDDSFCLLYTEDGSINFGELGIWKSVKGSASEQLVQFDFSQDAFPSALRLDLGIKLEQTEVTLKSVIIEKGDKRREITGAELGIFFRADASNCTFDVATGVVKPIVKDGVRKNPCLYPSEKILAEEIKKLAI
jgi:hypothetical protein